MRRTQRGNVSFRTIGLAETMFGHYYNGFSNGTLWPLFHYFPTASTTRKNSMRRTAP